MRGMGRIFRRGQVYWIAYSYLHGFDPSLCWSYGGCREYLALEARDA